ncbi:MAG: hypothetical protein JWM99_5100, partial [Verrucomicrobiales bacterium]|nr:hypothetical protein [Verrucomicrobiales bacterium]
MSFGRSNFFLLESLEARILLSGTDLLASAATVTASHIAADSHEVHHEISAVNDTLPQGQLPSTTSEINDIFSGVSGEVLQAPAEQTSSDHSAAPVQESVKSDSKIVVVPGANSVETNAKTDLQPATPTAGDNSISNNKNVEQSVDTLKAANPPPSSEVVDVQSIVSSLSPPSQKAAQPRFLSTLPDFLNAITDHLASAVGSSINDSISLGDLLLGGFLRISNPTISFSVTVDNSGGTRLYTGSVTISAGSATLKIGTGLTATITGLTGTYSLTNKSLPTGGKFGITGAQFSLSIPSLLAASGSNLNLSYDPNGSDNQVIASLASFSASLVPFNNSIVIANALTVSKNGFSISDGELPGLTTLGVDGLVDLRNSRITFSGMSYTVGGTLSGTISLHVASATLFPGKTFYGVFSPGNGHADALTGTYSLSTQTFSLVSDLFRLTVGEALVLDASGFTITYSRQGPADQTLIIIPTMTAGSALFNGVDPAEITNVVIRGNGFSFGSLTLSQTAGQNATIGGFLSASGVAIATNGFSVNYSSGVVTGAVSVQVENLNLFPGGNFVQSSFTNITAAFAFETAADTGKLAITIGSFKIKMGEAIQVDASGVVLTPGQSTLATIASATLSSPLFQNLTTVAINNLTITQGGFSIGSVALTVAVNSV